MVSGLTVLTTCVGKLANRLCAWDVTIAYTLADSYLAFMSTTAADAAAAAAELAAIRKKDNYVELSTTHHFVSLAFESLDIIDSKDANFF